MSERILVSRKAIRWIHPYNAQLVFEKYEWDEDIVIAIIDAWLEKFLKENSDGKNKNK